MFRLKRTPVTYCTVRLYYSLQGVEKATLLSLQVLKEWGCIYLNASSLNGVILIQEIQRMSKVSFNCSNLFPSTYTRKDRMTFTVVSRNTLFPYSHQPFKASLRQQTALDGAGSVCSNESTAVRLPVCFYASGQVNANTILEITRLNI